MPANCLIVIGASAGGIEALKKLLKALPSQLPAAILIVVHLNPQGPSILPQILQKVTPLRVNHPHGGEAIQAGTVYVGPPNKHLVVADGSVQLTTAPRENRSRPAVDVLFRTAARAYGPRVIGVILTGSLDDGTAGLKEVKRCGGTAVVQDPSDASYPGMPRSALANVSVDHVVPLSEMPELLKSLCEAEVHDGD